MKTLNELEKRIENIERRNSKVEMDKAWETSLTRKISIIVLTYIVIVLFFIVMNLGNPFVNAIVPTIGFTLSTLSFPYVKKIWILKNFKV